MEFNIYPKGKGEPFKLMCQRFEVREEGFILYNSIDEKCQQGFLSFTNVAAIVPEQQRVKDWPYPNTPIHFYVYLKDRQEPIDIWAHAFRIEEKSHITFWGQKKDILGQIEHEGAMSEIYLAISEVIAILPSDGLVRRD